MPVRPMTRDQMFLFPPSLDELVGPDHPARFVADLVGTLQAQDWREMGIAPAGERLGASRYHAELMLGVWLYGFMVGIRSTRGLERACRDTVPFMWLTGMQCPDHVSLWRFYDAHREGMRELFRRTVRTAVEMGLVDLAMQAVDGTKIKGNATKRHTYDEKGLRRLMRRVEQVIRELESQLAAGEDSSDARLPQELRDSRRRRARIAEALKKVKDKDGPTQINLADEDTRLMKGRQGIIAGYNAQAMVSLVKEEYGGGLLITAGTVTNEAHDHRQLLPMIKQAEVNTRQKAGITLADGGYHCGENLKACREGGHQVLMSETQRQACKSPYHKDRFIYAADTDEYICPQGQRLIYRGVKRRKGRQQTQVYRGDGAVCRACPAFGVCTRDQRHGRGLEIGPYERELRAHRDTMAERKSQELYKKRKQTVEPVFGILKDAQGARQFLLRGIGLVGAEWSLLRTAFNLRTLWPKWVKLRASWTWTG